jgi:phosphopantetheinyl transferase (holo-ACP synthase)
MKALGEGLGQISPLDLEVRLDPKSGAPRVQLHRQALACAEEQAVSAWLLSLCHENGWAVAIAIARREAPDRDTEPLANPSMATTNEEGR